MFLLQDLCFGGTQRQAILLAERLDKRRFQPEFWMMRAGDDLAPSAAAAGVSLSWLRRDSSVGLAAVLELRRRLNEERPDILLLLTVVPNIWGRVWGRAASVPVIVGTCRGGASPRRQHEWLLWPLADHVVCNSLELTSRLARLHRVPPGRLSTIPNGLAQSDFIEGPRTDEPVLLHVGRFVADKDHETLLAAFDLVVRQRPAVRLLLVGEGRLKQAIQRRVSQLPFASRVEFPPAQPDLREVYRRASVFVLSSKREAQPNVVMEAMAAGLPVVATSAGGIPEMIENGRNGLLVRPGRPGLMAGALQQLIDDPAARRRMGDEGRGMAQSRYDADAMARHYEALFDRLAQCSPRSAR